MFGCWDAATGDAMCIADADFTDVTILLDLPGVEENHFSWGVAAP